MTTTLSPPIGEEAAFNLVRARAAAVPDAQVRRRGDVQLALDNINLGLHAIENRRADLESRWPAPRIEALNETRTLALAAVFASSRANLLDVEEKGLLALIAEMYDGRDKLFSVLDMAARWALIPAERVAKIRAGTGPIDGGQDLIDGVALVREFWSVLENKSPLTVQFVSDAEALGNRVVTEVKSDGARKATNIAAKEAAVLANRVWTLLVDAHAELRKAGFELWGGALDGHVPALQSREGKKRPKPTPPAEG